MNAVFSVEKGQGGTVILLHGFCETHEIWHNLISTLALTNKIFCPDLPGFGKSKLPENAFSISDIANQIIDWIKANKIDNPVIIGHSLGGYIALEIARQNSIKLKGLGLFHSTAQADTLLKKENRNKVIEFVSKNGTKPFLDTFVPSLFYQKDNPHIIKILKLCSATKKEAILKYSLAMRDRLDYIDILKTLTIPVLFLCGEHDTFIPNEASESQSNTCINSTLTFLANTAHLGMIENPTDSLTALKLFLAKCF